MIVNIPFGSSISPMMDAFAVLDLLPACCAGSRKRRRSAGPLAAGREAVDNAEPGEDAEPLAAGTDARDVLALIDGRHIPAKAAALRGRRHSIRKGKSKRSLTAAHKQLQAKMTRFNASGSAVTSDALMSVGTALGQASDQTHAVRGSSAWRRWTPEAIQKAAFAKGSLILDSRIICVYTYIIEVHYSYLRSTANC